MHDIDRALDRLLHTAANCPKEFPDAPSYGFETRLQCRMEQAAAENAAIFFRWIRAGAIGSALIMIIAAIVSYYHPSQPTVTDLDFSPASWASLAHD